MDFHHSCIPKSSWVSQRLVFPVLVCVYIAWIQWLCILQHVVLCSHIHLKSILVQWAQLVIIEDRKPIHYYCIKLGRRMSVIVWPWSGRAGAVCCFYCICRVLCVLCKVKLLSLSPYRPFDSLRKENVLKNNQLVCSLLSTHIPSLVSLYVDILVSPSPKHDFLWTQYCMCIETH